MQHQLIPSHDFKICTSSCSTQTRTRISHMLKRLILHTLITHKNTQMHFQREKKVVDTNHTQKKHPNSNPKPSIPRTATSSTDLTIFPGRTRLQSTDLPNSPNSGDHSKNHEDDNNITMTTHARIPRPLPPPTVPTCISLNRY